MNTSEVLNTAADLIEERGWHQGGDGFGPDGQLCVINALYTAGRKDWHEAWERTKEHVGIQYALDEWNDAEGRTAVEVVAVLRAAALVEAAKENPVITPQVVANVRSLWGDAAADALIAPAVAR